MRIPFKDSIAILRKLFASKIADNEINHRLEKQLSERTEQLQAALQQLEQQQVQLKETQAQLLHAEKMSSLGTLVAGFAHEINNPANFVYIEGQSLHQDLEQLRQFILELAGDPQTEADAKIQQLFAEKFKVLFSELQSIAEGTMRIRGLVQNLRNFSRLEEVERKKVRLQEGLQATVALVSTNYKHTVEFVCDFKEDPELECWPAQLNQVFMNLMVNACQAIEEKQQASHLPDKGILSIQTLIQNHHLEIRFKDTGKGMSPAVQKKIFEPFFTTKPVGSGVGLGLSISFEIIEKHQGKIQVHSVEGAGTTFIVKLPLSTSPNSEDTQNQIVTG